MSRLAWLLLGLPALAQAQAPDSVKRFPVTRTVTVDSIVEYRTRLVSRDSIVTPPPTTTAQGIRLGPFNATPGSIGTLFVNANNPGNLKVQLAAAETGGFCILAAPAGGSHSQYIVNGQWNFTRWRAKVDSFARDSSTWRKAYQKGSLCGVSIIDEPQCSSCWGGRPVPWNTVGQAACYAKNIFPGIPIFTRSNATTIAAGTTCLSGGMLQFDASMGNVATWTANQIAAAKAKGLVLTGGVNYDNGGKVVSGCIKSESRPGKCSMSAAELSTNLRRLLADTTVVCGGTMWGPNATRWSSYSSLVAVRDTMKKLTAWAKTRPRPKRCGG